jgi:hypothetical protein
MIFKLRGRTHCSLQKAMKIAVPASSASFGNVRSDRGTAPSYLAGQPEQFFSWEISCAFVGVKRECVRLVPDIEVLKILHSRSSIWSWADCRLRIASSSPFRGRMPTADCRVPIAYTSLTAYRSYRLSQLPIANCLYRHSRFSHSETAPGRRRGRCPWSAWAGPCRSWECPTASNARASRWRPCCSKTRS